MLNTRHTFEKKNKTNKSNREKEREFVENGGLSKFTGNIIQMNRK